MNRYADKLRELVRGDGPSPTDYPILDEIYRGIMQLVRSGQSTPSDLAALWPTLGDAFNDPDTMQGFGILKPHGYAGDFEMIDRIYTLHHASHPRLANWDRYFHSHKATHAVRNRKRYFLDLLARVRASRSGTVVRVLSVGSGPARECAECPATPSAPVTFDLVDRDDRALRYASRLNRESPHEIRYIHANAFRYRSDEPYDLIWSAGLFDYLGDDQFRALLKHLVQLLRPGGLISIGNFGPHNPSRDYMEFGHWFLNYRSDSQLYDLAHDKGRTTGFDNVCVDSEPEGINLFLHLTRDGDRESR